MINCITVQTQIRCSNHEKYTCLDLNRSDKNNVNAGGFTSSIHDFFGAKSVLLNSLIFANAKFLIFAYTYSMILYKLE